MMELTQLKKRDYRHNSGIQPVSLTRRIKAPVDPSTLNHKLLLDGPFWQRLPGYRHVNEQDFEDHRWQARNSVTAPDKLLAVLEGLVPKAFYDDVALGFRRAPMSVRVSPYLLALIDWNSPYDDPLRKQFIPVASSLLPDHPQLTLDSLDEQSDAPVPGLTHRYRDKALLLTLDTCPVYCRFCTRSYAVGIDTEQVEKVSLKAKTSRWEEAFSYIATRPELEDIVISGGDVYQLKPSQVEYLGMRLLNMDNILRIRFGTKGLAVMPQKILGDHEWLDALTRVVDFGRSVHKEVVVHTHFNHPTEVTAMTKRAMDRLFRRGIRVRNQTVLQRGVNDDIATMQLLVKRLSYCNVQPYYVFMHDLVKGAEDLRTPVSTALKLEKAVRGTTAGFNTPTFVCDSPGGGGKREIHSYDHYNVETGICVYSAPSVKTGHFLYFDPMNGLSREVQRRWQDPSSASEMIREAMHACG